MYSYRPLHMPEQKQDDQLEHTYSSSVRIWDVALKTCQKRWTVGRSGKRGSGISVLAARHDDDEGAIYAVSVLQQGCTTWTLTKSEEKNLDGNYQRMLCGALNKSQKQHPKKLQLYSLLPPILPTIQVRQARRLLLLANKGWTYKWHEYWLTNKNLHSSAV